MRRRKILYVVCAVILLIFSAPLWAVSQSAFFDMCMEGNTDGVIKALRSGANVNARDNDGMTALMQAAGTNAESVKILLKAKADPNAKDDEGATALIWSAREGYPETVIALLNAGADVKARDKNGKRAVDYAREIKDFKGSKALRQLESLSK